MTTAAELDALLVRSLADIDDATKRMRALDDKCWSALVRIVDNWAEGTGWISESDKDEITFAPASWRLKGADWKGWYQVYFGYGDTGKGAGDEDCFQLTRFCGKGRGGYSIYFYRNTERYERVSFKKACFEMKGRLSELGFSLDEGTNFHMPFRLSSEKIAQAIIEGKIDDGLEGFRAELDKSAPSAPIFEELLKRTASLQKRKKA